MWCTYFVVGVALTCGCAMGIDWTDEAEKFFTKLSGIWRTGQCEDVLNVIYSSEAIRLTPGEEEVVEYPKVVQLACSITYAAGYTELQTVVQHVLPTGDNSAVVWIKFTFVNQNGSVMNGKDVFVLVNEKGRMRLVRFN